MAPAQRLLLAGRFVQARLPQPVHPAYAEENEATTERSHVASIGELTGTASGATLSGYGVLPSAPVTASVPVQPLESR
jgi:hypothetical protein